MSKSKIIAMMALIVFAMGILYPIGGECVGWGVCQGTGSNV